MLGFRAQSSTRKQKSQSWPSGQSLELCVTAIADIWPGGTDMCQNIRWNHHMPQYCSVINKPMNQKNHWCDTFIDYQFQCPLHSGVQRQCHPAAIHTMPTQNIRQTCVDIDTLVSLETSQPYSTQITVNQTLHKLLDIFNNDLSMSLSKSLQKWQGEFTDFCKTADNVALEITPNEH